MIHQPCKDCNSSDALQLNEDGSTKCHSCGKFKTNTDNSYVEQKAESDKGYVFTASEGPSAVPERGISNRSMSKYGAVRKGDTVYFPYLADSMEIVGSKVRRLNEKTFYSEGCIKGAGLFGQHVFTPGSAKTITIVEGEFDAIACYQLQGSKYPVVSIKNGAKSALSDCKASFNYLNSFDEIVINFDADGPGQIAALEVCNLFAGKTRNVVLTQGKDANDYLMADKAKEYTSEWWNGQKYRPDDVVGSESLLEEVLKPLSLPVTNYPWDGINLLTYGIRRGEIVTVVAGTGAGKSTFMKSVIEHILDSSKLRVGVMSLEESVQTTALGLMSIACNKPLHLPTKAEMQEFILNDPANIIRKPGLADTITIEEKKEAYESVLGSGRLTFYRSGGNMTIDGVIGRMQYMAKAEDCPIIVLDHISVLVGMQQAKSYGNERESIDECMHRLRCLVEETNCTVLLVSHLSRGDSSSIPHEEGGRVRLNQLRGSQAIAQLSNIAIAIERNSQAESSEERALSTIRILKNRFSGETGEACRLRWMPVTGRLVEQDRRLGGAL